MRARRSVLAAALSLVVVSGCTPTGETGGDTGADTTTAPYAGRDDSGIPDVTAVMPLPAGAQVTTALPATLPTDGLDTDCDLLGTLRPVDEPAGDLVPRIRDRGRLIVGMDQGSNLFSFRDPRTGRLTGFDVDLAREITTDIFGNPDQVEYRSLTSANRIEALQEHQVDVVIRSMSITCERREQVTFSAPYYQAYQRVAALRESGISDLEDLEGRRVCVAAGTTSASRMFAELQRVTVLSVNTWADCLVALQQNQVDAITTDDAILAGITAQDPYLEIVGPQLDAEPYGVGVARSTPEYDTDGLVRQVNRTLARIRTDGTWNRMYAEWLSDLGPTPGMPAPSYLPDPPEPEGEP